jgi:hypothetical protein
MVNWGTSATSGAALRDLSPVLCGAPCYYSPLLAGVSGAEILDPKIHMKSDNYDVLRELYHFVREK